jgi:tRNA threonylcarbamoyladenosine biosynthesis protein TsaE
MLKIERHEPLILVSEDAADTRHLGRLIAQHGLRPSDVIALSGPLGAGKTVFVKGLAEGLGVEKAQPVTSPTFVLMNKYAGRMPLYHFDAYRLRSAADMLDIGCEEIFFGPGVSVVEWADRVPECLPDERLWVRIEIIGPASRRIALTPLGERWAGFVASLAKAIVDNTPHQG